jgi:predicted  nucleic acid-binding Zn-ribbon protein
MTTTQMNAEIKQLRAENERLNNEIKESIARILEMSTSVSIATLEIQHLIEQG